MKKSILCVAQEGFYMKMQKSFVVGLLLVISSLSQTKANPSQQQATMAQQMAQQNQQANQQRQRPLSHQGMQGNIIQGQQAPSQETSQTPTQTHQATAPASTGQG